MFHRAQNICGAEYLNEEIYVIMATYIDLGYSKHTFDDVLSDIWMARAGWIKVFQKLISM